jgi:hypothetical protein
VKLYRPVTILVGVVLVLLSGIARLGEPKQVMDDVTWITKHGSMNQPLKGTDFALTVVQARAYKKYDPRPDDDDAEAKPDDKPRKSDGVFIAVNFEVEGSQSEGSAGDATLRSDSGTVYVPLNKLIHTLVDIPAPGFVENQDLLFEVNPADLAGLTFNVRQGRVITTTAEQYEIDLGLPDQATADEFVARAGKMYVSKDPKVWTR